MGHVGYRVFRNGSPLCLLLAVLVIAGCGKAGATARPATPTAKPTPTVGFAVVLTPVRGNDQGGGVVSHRPTPFVPPKGAYLVLIPHVGPPNTSIITVRGGHLPKAAQIHLVWSGEASSAATAYTDQRGRLSTRFLVPGTSPGSYSVLAQVNGATKASAVYTVTSSANLSAVVTSDSGGGKLVITGKRFIPSLRLLLVAYAIDSSRPPVRLAILKTSNRGAFTVSRPARTFEPGQYLLRAFSLSNLSPQTAEAFFEVTL